MAALEAIQREREGVNRRPDKVNINNKAGLEASIQGTISPPLPRRVVDPREWREHHVAPPPPAPPPPPPSPYE